VKEENKEVLDLTFLKEFCSNDRKKMAQYIHTFLETVPEDLRSMQEASDHQQWIQLKSIAHSLKPQVMFIGLPALQLILEKIEAQTMESNPKEDVQSLVSDLEKALEMATDVLIQTLVTLS
jgi:HPt (histidine-containing phosphotransfer) domain-containing protein